MASAVAEGAREKGAEATLITAAGFSADQVGDYDAIAFGCPSMGAEQLEETEFEPMFTSCEGVLQGKTIALFGSYGICNEAPDDEALSACRALGAALAEK